MSGMQHVDEWNGLIYHLEHIEETLRMVTEKAGLPAQLNMGSWRTDEEDCGTTCCAIGIGIMTGTITGIRLKPQKRAIAESPYTGYLLRVVADGSESGESISVARYFGIFEFESEGCFGCDVPNDELVVAMRMRQVARAHGVEVTA